MGLSGLVMVDEPGLMAAHRAGAAPAVWDALRAAAPAWGLHVCGEVPWPLLDAAEPDVISYDLARSGCGPAAQTVIRRLMRRRGRIMWGAIDPVAIDESASVLGRVSAAARAVAGRRWRTQDVLGACLLSGSCGTGGVSVSAEGRVARGLQAVAGRLRGNPEPQIRVEATAGRGARRPLHGRVIGGYTRDEDAEPESRCDPDTVLATVTTEPEAQSPPGPPAWEAGESVRPGSLVGRPVPPPPRSNT